MLKPSQSPSQSKPTHYSRSLHHISKFPLSSDETTQHQTHSEALQLLSGSPLHPRARALPPNTSRTRKHVHNLRGAGGQRASSHRARRRALPAAAAGSAAAVRSSSSGLAPSTLQPYIQPEQSCCPDSVPASPEPNPIQLFFGAF